MPGPPSMTEFGCLRRAPPSHRQSGINLFRSCSDLHSGRQMIPHCGKSVLRFEDSTHHSVGCTYNRMTAAPLGTLTILDCLDYLDCLDHLDHLDTSTTSITSTASTASAVAPMITPASQCQVSSSIETKPHGSWTLRLKNHSASTVLRPVDS